MDIKNIPAYELVSEQSLKEVDSHGYLLRHKKTGARVAVLENDDDNKVFNIAFRTPPENSKGIPHIVEHTVLCGSEKYPVKDPFAEMDKGSLNTFLNAMTYPDRTVYPVASVNMKDFKNLMDIYLDAVFFPKLHEEEKIFRQEGWHYELESVDGELTYNGVVFNEMKGAFSSPDEYLEKLVGETLFPDTTYSVVSGGDPTVIPELTWEEYKDFHKKYYHPSNSYIYLYGDMDMEERLAYIDSEYLDRFERLDVDSKIAIQKAFDKTREAEGFYPVGSDEDTENKTYFAYAAVCGTSLDPYLYQAFQVLEYALVEGIGAPVKEALVKAGIGTEISGSYSAPFAQPFFSIDTKQAPEDKKDLFISTIRGTLKELADGGLNKQSLKSALNAMEFQFREADFGNFPKGLMYGLEMYDSWIYDEEKPFIHLLVDDIFASLREKIETDYFENLIRDYLLDNPHSILVTLKPKPGMASEMEEKERQILADHLASLSDEEREALVVSTQELKKYQEEPSTPEELATIPVLTREDIGKKARKHVNEERVIGDTPVVFHDVFTNGITYLRFAFQINDLEEYAPYIGLLADVMGVMDTDKYDKFSLSNELLYHAGGYGVSTNSYVRYDEDSYKICLELTTKVLFDETATVLGLIDEIVQKTHLSDTERLKEIIGERRSGRLASLQSAGHMTALNRATSYFRGHVRWADEMKGLAYYDFLCEMGNNFDKEKENISNMLTWLSREIFRKERLIISVTTTEEGYKVFSDSADIFLKNLNRESAGEKPEPPYHVPTLSPNEGIKMAGNVQYVARAGFFSRAGVPYHGSFRVLRTILSYEYLWNEVRVKGGAYGVMCNFLHTGSGYMVSYRDPHLRETDDAFKSVVDYLKNFDASEKDMVKFIIGSIRVLDTPLTPKGVGVMSFDRYMIGRTMEQIQQVRDEVLSTTKEDIRNCAKMVEALLADEYICVVGNEEKIDECKDMFGSVRSLM